MIESKSFLNGYRNIKMLVLSIGQLSKLCMRLLVDWLIFNTYQMGSMFDILKINRSYIWTFQNWIEL